MRFGEAIRKERQARGLSLRDLQEATGLTYSVISKIERGRTEPSFRSVSRIAKALRMSLDSLAKFE
jgi:transcriptional regulator with XRE-family HTH domain